MPESEFKARQVGAKTHEVVDYHRNDELPGKPLHILIPGGVIALATLALIIYVIYRTWFEGTLDQSLGTTLLMLLAPFYVGGVFLFSYGYELYNIPRALRLTAIIVFVTLAAVVIVAVLFVLLSGESKAGSKSSKSSGSKGNWALGSLGGAAATKNSSSKNTSVSSNSSSSNSGWGSSGGPIYTGGNIFVGSGPTRVETREVTKEVPKEPMPITCPFCKTSYIPVEHKYICPNCGAGTPKELIEESQMPKNEK